MNPNLFMTKRNLVQACLLGLLFFLSAAAQAQFTFTTNNGAITITGYNTAAGLNMVIPAATNGFPVTSIGVEAFFGSSLTSVSIPSSVTSIGEDAFGYCDGLTSVTLPNSVTTIGIQAFFYCTGLTNVAIPNSVTSIGEAAFSDAGLTSVTIPNSITTIGEAAFEECYGLTSVTIPNGVTTIEDDAFGYCYNLTSVTIPSSVTSIGGKAFEICYSLTSVTIPNSVTTIGGGAFSYCATLTNITVAAANPAYSSLGGVLFDKAKATLIQFPAGLGGGYVITNSVTVITNSAFYNCYLLTSVVIPNSVTTIGNDAFSGCTSLTSVTIGNGLTNIADFLYGNFAFAGCSSLSSAYFLGNAPPNDGTVFSSPAIVYYLAGTIGWGPTFGGVPAVLWNPQPNASNFTGGHFGFNLTGPANTVVVVDACTNLSHAVWLPIATNIIPDNSTSAFSDLQSGAHPTRFYRERSP